LNLVAVETVCLELDCIFSVGIFVAFRANVFVNATHLKVWVVKTPKPMVGVDGDDRWLWLIVV